MTRKPRARVGIIGLGLIGSRVAATLRAAGHQVYVWSRSPRAEPNFLGSAVEVADLSDVLQLFVSDDAALLETVRTIAPALGPRHLVAAHATVSPAAAREAARTVEDRGARYLDAPFAGSKVAAGSGQLVYYVAGTEAAVREARPILEISGKSIVTVGEAAGQAAVVKIATNMLNAGTLQVLVEALAVARAAGVEPTRFVEALENHGARSALMDGKLPGILKGDFEPHFALKHLLKDARLALGLAAEHKLTVPATATVAALAYGGVQRGWGEKDFSVLARNYDPPAPRPVPSPSLLPASVSPLPVAPGEFPPPSGKLPEREGEHTPASGESTFAPGERTRASGEITFTPGERTPASGEHIPGTGEAPATPANVPAKRAEVPASLAEGPDEGAKAKQTLPSSVPDSSRPPPDAARPRAPAPPAFPFAPPPPRAPADAPPSDRRPPPSAPQTPAPPGNGQEAAAPAPTPPPARRSLLSSLFGREK